MPKKKRYQTKYSKPPSTAPSSLVAASSSSSHSGNNRPRDTQPRTVNSLLTSLRSGNASHVNHATPQSQASAMRSAGSTPAASLPPVIRQILNLSEDPAPPPPRRPVQGRRRLPPGPPPPASWLSSVPGATLAGQQGREPGRPSVSRLCGASGDVLGGCHHTALNLPELPGTRSLSLGHKSLVAMSLRKIAHTWSFQRPFNQYHLYRLPGGLRSALIAMLCRHNVNQVSIQDLRALFTMPELPDDPEDWEEEIAMNDDVHELDLSGCLGNQLSLKELCIFLQGTSREGSESSSLATSKGKEKGAAEEEIHESWETVSLSPSVAPPLSCTLPYLTHLSLALHPADKNLDRTMGFNISWKQFLSITSKLASLTHLSLANWPAPALSSGYVTHLPSFLEPASDPNQKAQLAEAVFVVRKMSKALYGLQYLDISGCHEWWDVLHYSIDTISSVPSSAEFEILPRSEERSSDPVARVESVLQDPSWPQDPAQEEVSSGLTVDWVGDWGKMETVIMKSCPSADPERAYTKQPDFGRSRRAARVLERYVRGQRLGRGRLFTVEGDQYPDFFRQYDDQVLDIERRGDGD